MDLWRSSVGWVEHLLGVEEGDESGKRPIEIGGPTNFVHGLHIEVDNSTGHLKGVPEEWTAAGFEVSNTATTTALPDVLKPRRQVVGLPTRPMSTRFDPDQVFAATMAIGRPTSFKHNFHVTVDVNSDTGFAGLPPEWVALLHSNNITLSDMRLNPSEIMNVIDFQLENKLKKPPPRTADALNALKEAAEMRRDDPSKQFKSLLKIGEGGCGAVYYAERVDDNQRVAIKVISRSAEADMTAVENEIALMKLSCSHPNVVKYMETFLTRTELWVVMEYAPGGSLTQLLMFNKLSEPQIAFICRESLRALHFLHSESRIHRDIKSDNFLLDMDGGVKLADFGFAAQLTAEGQNRKSVVGTPFWMAVSNFPISILLQISCLANVSFDEYPIIFKFMIPARGNPRLELRHRS
jgi:p21-activated kinase 2